MRVSTIHRRYVNAAFLSRALAFLLLSPLFFSILSAQNLRWEPAGGPTGGSVSLLFVAKNDYLFAVAPEVGLARSTDNGDHWQRVTDGLDNINILSMTENPRGNIHVSAGMSGIYRSTNNGGSWEKMSGPPGNNQTFALTFLDDTILIAGTESGIYRSADGGYSWTKATSDSMSVRISDFAIDRSGTLFAGTIGGSGVFKSTDSGLAWSPVGGEIAGRPSVRVLLLDSSGVLFTGTNGFGIYHSGNNGESWVRSDSGTDEWFITSLILDHEGNVLAGTWDNALYRSIDGGGSWQKIAQRLRGSHVEDIAVNSSGTLFLGMYQGTVLRSHDGGTNWEESAQDWPPLPVSFLAVSPNGTLFAAAGPFGLFRSSDDGESWEYARLASMMVGIMAFDSAGGIWAIEDRSALGLRYSSDNGNGWIKKGFEGDEVFSLNVTPEGTLFAGVLSSTDSTGGILYRSTDKGESWEKANEGLVNTVVQSLRSRSGGELLAGGTSVFACVEHGTYLCFEFIGGFFRSFDQGTSWQREDVTNRTIFDMHVISQDTIILATSGGIYQTTDNGRTWLSPQQTGVTSAARSLLRTARGDILTNAPRTTYLSSNHGKTWSEVSAGIENRFLSNIVVARSGAILIGATGDILAGNPDHGLLRLDGYPNNIGTTSENMPYSVRLEQNHPNPFNNSTHISFELDKTYFVTLKIYDILGREVALLLHSSLTAGTHSINWNANNVGSGIYYYELQARSDAPGRNCDMVRKFILLK